MNFFLTSTASYPTHDSSPIFIGCIENQVALQISLTQVILDEYQIITFDSTLLVEFCRKQGLTPPTNIIDVFQLFKLIEGSPQKLHKLSYQKLIWIIFKRFFDNEQLKLVIDVLGYTSAKIISTNSIDKLIQFNIYLQEVYKNLLSELKVRNEADRFYTIEKPFNEILCQRQFRGIHVSNKILSEKIDFAKAELNMLAKKLRYDYNIFSPQNITEIRHALQNAKYDYLSKSINTKSFWGFIKSGAEHDEFLNLLYTSYRLRFDKQNLIKIITEKDGVVYPIFDCCGTITSRALVRLPFIQQLKKNFRTIFVAKDGYELLYADYSQFEPGILASLANDPALINCYNTADLYNSLSVELIGNESSRTLCKIIFLSFMYGMSNKGLEYLIKDFFKDKSNVNVSDINLFFSKFKSLIPYKLELETLALKENKISSSLGNHRYFKTKSTKVLPSKVKRWILSQKIQGTASLILKTAIINCIQDQEIEFLIPMHDAALFQVPAGKLEEKKIVIKKEFTDAFTTYCPKIKPKVIFKDFTE